MRLFVIYLIRFHIVLPNLSDGIEPLLGGCRQLKICMGLESKPIYFPITSFLTMEIMIKMGSVSA